MLWLLHRAPREVRGWEAEGELLPSAQVLLAELGPRAALRDADSEARAADAVRATVPGRRGRKGGVPAVSPDV